MHSVGFICLLAIGLLGLQAQTPDRSNMSDTDSLPSTDSRSIRPSYLDEPYAPSTRARQRFRDRRGSPFDQSNTSALVPSNYTRQFQLDTGQYYAFQEQIGSIDYKPPIRLGFDQYQKYYRKQLTRSYLRQRARELDGEDPLGGGRGLLVPKIYVGPWLDRLFGGSFVTFEPNILITLDLGSRWNYVANPALPVRQRRNWLLDFKQQLTANITGKIGEKLAITFNYDTQSPFAGFGDNVKNNLNIAYTGYKRDIIKKAEVGNVSMPLGNSLIRGSQNLFGFRLVTQFGRFQMTNVISSQQGQHDNLALEGGQPQGRSFNIQATNYIKNQHFFLGHFFRDHYEEWLETRPQVTSGVRVTRLEVYVLNRSNQTESLRNIVAWMDLGESDRIHQANNPRIVAAAADVPTSNNANSLFAQIQNEAGPLRDLNSVEQVLSGWDLEAGTDYERVSSARRLNANEYTFHESLGILSLSRSLQNDEVLAVSYEYTYNGERYQVGELSENYQALDVSRSIFLKLLRHARVRTELPAWDLMMKNTYSLGTTSLERSGLELRIFYRDDSKGLEIPALNEGLRTRGEPIIELMGLDTLNVNGDPVPDGNFDYIENVTVFSSRGWVRFPVLEPFGATLGSYFNPETEQSLIDRYVFDALYRGTKEDAERLTNLNKYALVGTFQTGSSQSQIRLPALGVVEGSVRVTAGGAVLVEGQDYTVDYTLGQVNIINSSILSSGKDLDVQYEKADLLSSRTRTLLGTRVDYSVLPNLVVGGTLLYLGDQRGSVTRYQIGNAPVRNVKYGFDVRYEQESLGLTRVLSKAPFISSSQPSKITVNAEVAQLVPGTSNLSGDNGVFYIDDFEDATLPTNLSAFRSWQLASTPQRADGLLDIGTVADPLGYNYRRAKLAWYTIDTEFYSRPSARANLGASGASNHYVRSVPPQEIFPQRDVAQGVITESTFDLAYFPEERGPYNYTSSLTDEGLLPNPRGNWGGVTRAISNEVDFDRINIEYIEFWLMDPFINTDRGRVFDGRLNRSNTTGGRLLINLGDISEDVVPDNRHGFEQGLSPQGGLDGVVETDWGRVPAVPYISPSFVNDPSLRSNQDVGLDGLSDDQERDFFESSFLDRLSPTVRGLVEGDPSADNFSFYLGGGLDDRGAGIIERYKYFNQAEGNSPIVGSSNVRAPIGRNDPDNEDLNQDNTVSDVESYYEYAMDLRPNQLAIGQQHIVDRIQSGETSWYLFRIPVRRPDRTQGSITGFKSIKFMRLYLTDFEEPVVLRMANFRIVESRWIDYVGDLSDARVSPGVNTVAEVSSVNIEENTSASEGKSPYVLPPGVARDENDFSLNRQRYSEQSLQLCVRDLENGDARAVFKPLAQNFVNYSRLRMFFHADGPIEDGQVHAFLRIGTDYDQNYYEIAVPMVVTPASVGGDIARAVWPRENEIDLAIDQLYAVKLRRDRAGADEGTPYTHQVGNHLVTIVGRPKVSELQVLMIGVRNPYTEDSGIRTACIWANELRVEGIQKKNGWAFNTRINTSLADVADIAFSTRYSSLGFGEIQDQVQQRALSTDFSYDISSTWYLDKFIPAETGLNIPLYMSLEETSSRPEFDPLDSDVPINAVLLSLPPEEASTYEQLATEHSTRRSINVTGLSKDYINEETKRRFYHIENVSVDLVYSDFISRNISKERLQRQSRASFNYDFTTQPLYFIPFEKKITNQYLALIKDQNISPFPNAFSFSLDLDRNFERETLQDFLAKLTYDPVYKKNFLFNRNYTMGWALFKSLKLRYNSDAKAVVDEPVGEIDTQEKRNEIWTNVRNFGRIQRFDQTVRGDYQVPISKFPLLGWIQSTLNYQAKYTWLSASRAQRTTLGNSIENNRQMGATVTFSLASLYNQLGIKPAGASRSEEAPRFDARPFFIGLATLIKSVNMTYTLRHQTLLAGYTPTHYLLGQANDFSSPGWNFVLGSQNPDIRFQAARNGWLVQNEQLTAPFKQRGQQELSLQGTIEPFKAFSIQLEASRNVVVDYEEIFRYDTFTSNFASFTPSRKGNYTISYLSIATSFGQAQRNAFSQFVQNRSIIQQRLIASTGQPYPLDHHDVLVPAFSAAYLGTNAETARITPFRRIPLPNWRVSYNGLSGIPTLAEALGGLTLSHAYRSSYGVGNFTSSLVYGDNFLLSEGLILDRYASIVQAGNLVPFYVLDGVRISEDFSPLAGIDVRLKNDMSFRTSYRRTREAALSLSNVQVREQIRNEITFGYSFSKDNLRLPFALFGRQVIITNTVSFQANITYRNTQSIQHLINQQAQTTAGNTAWDFRFNLDYKLSQVVTAQLYVERGVDRPLLTSSFQRNRTAVGVRINVSWSQ